eukprot:NODE_405_length_9256_cov_0.230316.p2 type:complete len:371 gc:universal NODE_405_length_9256_cov_0.230316:4915-3803(-)
MLLTSFAYALKEVMNLENCGNVSSSSSLNISMVASLGDSVLTGFGSRQSPSNWPFLNYFNFVEDRGVTAINGADSDAISVFNIIKKFNPNLLGGSTGSHSANICSGALCLWPFNRFLESDGLNMATTGAFASDLNYQSSELIRRFKKLYENQPTLENSWKFIALWIGLNDQCRYCSRKESGIQKFEYHVKRAIDKLRSELKYVIVDVISLWNIDHLVDLSSKHRACKNNKMRQFFFRKHCSCAFGKNSNSTRKGMPYFQKKQNEILSNIVESYRNGTSWSTASTTNWVGTPSTFKLIYDPSSEDMDLNQYDSSIVTRSDCSHPTKETQGRLATVFWQNLFLNSTKKLRTQKWAFSKNHVRYVCPSEIKFE